MDGLGREMPKHLYWRFGSNPMDGEFGWRVVNGDVANFFSYFRYLVCGFTKPARQAPKLS